MRMLSLEAECVAQIGLVAGGYNQDWNHEDVLLSSTELYSLSSADDCDHPLPDLPVARRGMVGGWAGGQAVVCGGEDGQGVIWSDCFTYDITDNVWLYLTNLQLERSYAAAEVINGCLYVSGGITNEGPTESVEIVSGQ